MAVGNQAYTQLHDGVWGTYANVHGGVVKVMDGMGRGLDQRGGVLRKGEGCTGLFEYLRKGGELMECV